MTAVVQRSMAVAVAVIIWPMVFWVIPGRSHVCAVTSEEHCYTHAMVEVTGRSV